jgi:hypothetical protein
VAGLPRNDSKFCVAPLTTTLSPSIFKLTKVPATVIAGEPGDKVWLPIGTTFAVVGAKEYTVPDMVIASPPREMSGYRGRKQKQSWLSLLRSQLVNISSKGEEIWPDCSGGSEDDVGEQEGCFK